MEEFWKLAATSTFSFAVALVLMMIRSDWMGRKAAEAVKRDLTLEIGNVESRVNIRIDKLEQELGKDIGEIKNDIREIRVALTSMREP